MPYRETIRKKANAQGRHKKQTGGRGQFGDCWIEVEPLPRGEGYKFEDAIFGGSIPRNFIPAVEKGIVEAMEHGVIAGYPVVDVKVKLYDGSYHTVDSSELAFKLAGGLAWNKAMSEAMPVLLEPVMNVEVIAPEENMGDIMGDLSSRRGRPQGSESMGEMHVIRAQVPLAEMLTYAPQLAFDDGGAGLLHDGVRSLRGGARRIWSTRSSPKPRRGKRRSSADHRSAHAAPSDPSRKIIRVQRGGPLGPPLLCPSSVAGSG